MGLVVRDARVRWANGVIPYEIDAAITASTQASSLLATAIDHWNAVAPLRLARRVAESDHLLFLAGLPMTGGNASGTARQGQVKLTMDYGWALTDGNQTVISALLHELGHVAGLGHEHQRPDRDHYVIIANNDANPQVNSDYGALPLGDYDCSSLMHYRTVNTASDPAVKPGGCAQLSGPWLSLGDLAALHYLSPAGVWWGAVDDEAIAAAPAVCTAAYGQLRVVAQRPDQSLGWRTFEQGGWTPWRQVATNPVLGQPAAASWEPGRIDVVVRGTDNRPYHNICLDRRGFPEADWIWSGYVPVGSGGNQIASAPTLVAPAPGQLELVARGTDSALWNTTYVNGAWGAWRQVASNPVSSEPALFVWGPADIGLVVLGTDGRLYMNRKLNGQWRAYTPVDPARYFASAPAVCAPAPNRLELFALAADYRLQTGRFDGNAWGSWRNLGQRVLSSPPAAASWGPDRVDVFVRDNNRLAWIPVQGEPTWWRRS